MTTKKNIRFEPWVPFRKWKYDENTDEFFVEDETTVKCRRVMKWQAVQPEKRGSQIGSKGNDKGRSDTKGGSKGGKDRKWGKGPQPKGGASRRKDEVPGKACAPGA